MNRVERAELKSRQRATIFYLLAVMLLLSLVAGGAVETTAARLAPWYVTIGLTALNLTALPFRLRRDGLGPLMNDDITRLHRRMSFEAGFWASLAAAALTTGVAALQPLNGVVAGRVTITAGLVAALVSFATLELRAARG